MAGQKLPANENERIVNHREFGHNRAAEVRGTKRTKNYQFQTGERPREERGTLENGGQELRSDREREIEQREGQERHQEQKEAVQGCFG